MLYRHLSLLPEEVDKLVVGLATLGKQVLGVMREGEGDDLHVDLPVALHELIQGAEVVTPTPDGPVSLKIPKASANGGKLRLAGKGATKRGTKDRGNLYVHLQATLPPAGEPLEAIAEELKALYDDTNIRAKLGV